MPSNATITDPVMRVRSCPRCGWTITPKAPWMQVHHCPRCIAYAHVAVKLLSTAPTYDRVTPTREAGTSSSVRRRTAADQHYGPRRAAGECPVFCVGMSSRKETHVDDNLKQVG